MPWAVAQASSARGPVGCKLEGREKKRVNVERASDPKQRPRHREPENTPQTFPPGLCTAEDTDV